MTNYIIDQNIDFYNILNNFSKELQEEKKEVVVEEVEEKEVCLISNEPLTKYHITLPCKHKFNYLPLLYACAENSQLHQNYRKGRLKCPYCKQVNHDHVLPYNPLLEATKYRYVNYPQKNIINASNTCTYTYKAGKNKGNTCGLQCYWGYCHKHLKYLDTTNKTKTKVKTKPVIDVTSIDLKNIGMDDLKKMTVVILRQLAKHNKKKNFSKLKKADLILLLKSE